jgi:hypothetical protein
MGSNGMRSISARMALFASAASCARAAVSAPAPIEIHVSSPERLPEGEEPTAAPLSLTAAAPDELPTTWTTTSPRALSFTEALGRARSAQYAYDRIRPPLPPDGAPDPTLRAWFVEAAHRVEEASRSYALAFHAENATSSDRLLAMAEAAELELGFMRKLGEYGLVAMPLAWRTDPSMRATFEDVANGPFRRWHDEARSLAHGCIELAHAGAIEDGIVARCRSVSAAIPTLPRATTACGCVPGDPLCSASLSGWCSP